MIKVVCVWVKAELLSLPAGRVIAYNSLSVNRQPKVSLIIFYDIANVSCFKQNRNGVGLQAYPLKAVVFSVELL